MDVGMNFNWSEVPVILFVIYNIATYIKVGSINLCLTYEISMGSIGPNN